MYRYVGSGVAPLSSIWRVFCLLFWVVSRIFDFWGTMLHISSSFCSIYCFLCKLDILLHRASSIFGAYVVAPFVFNGMLLHLLHLL